MEVQKDQMETYAVLETMVKGLYSLWMESPLTVALTDEFLVLAPGVRDVMQTDEGSCFVCLLSLLQSQDLQ